MHQKFEVRAQRNIIRNRIEVLVFQRTESGATAVGQPLVFAEVPENAHYTEPTMELTMDVAQALMDELWTCGLRPTEGAGSAGAMAATERHLKDMQAITKGLLKKDGIEV